MPQTLVNDVHVLPYNNLKPVEELFSAVGSQIAAVIVEPVAGNMGLISPIPGFLEGLRTITEKSGSILIFDEVITGFRLHAGTCAELFGIRPDIIVLGKIIGGGMPIGGIAGPEGIMELLAPIGQVYQAGTLSGNPVAAAAGIATLRKVQEHGESMYKRLEKMTGSIAHAIESAAKRRNIDMAVSHIGGNLHAIFS